MSIRAVIIVFLAVLCGVSAAVGFNQLRPPPQPTSQKVETTPILVAKVDIDQLSAVTMEVLETRPWPKDLVPQGALADPKDAVERMALTKIVAGEPLLASKLAIEKGARGIEELVPSGMRAMSIPAQRVNSQLAGMLLPRSLVDVIVNLQTRGKKDDETGGSLSLTVFQALEVLAVDQRIEMTVDNKVEKRELRSVTFLVPHQKAALLDVAVNAGQVTLALRNRDDKQTLETPTFNDDSPVVTTLSELMKYARTFVTPEEPPKELAQQPAPLRGERFGRVMQKEERKGPVERNLLLYRGGHRGTQTFIYQDR